MEDSPPFVDPNFGSVVRRIVAADYLPALEWDDVDVTVMFDAAAACGVRCSEWLRVAEGVFYGGDDR